MKIDGGCHCGYITYAAEADPERTTICHCTDCQRLSGSAFRVVVRVPGDTFKVTAGEPTIYVKTAESGARRVQGFCPRCGTPIYSTAEGDEPEILLHPCRDCPPTCCDFPPTAHLALLTTRLGDRSRLHPQAGKAVSHGALIGCDNQFRRLRSCFRKSACISLRQRSPSKHILEIALAGLAC
jgi:hypothetical protein